MATPAPAQHFDHEAVTWYPLGDIQHMEFAILDLDVDANVVDFMVRFEANERIVMHRHLAYTNTFVVHGEHRLYEPNGDLKEVRPVGTFTSSPPAEPHYEGAGAQPCVVLYNIRGAVDGNMFEIMDDDGNVVALLGVEDLKGAWAEQKGSPVRAGGW